MAGSLNKLAFLLLVCFHHLEAGRFEETSTIFGHVGMRVGAVLLRFLRLGWVFGILFFPHFGDIHVGEGRAPEQLQSALLASRAQRLVLLQPVVHNKVIDPTFVALVQSRT